MNVDKHKAPLSPLELEEQHSEARKAKETKCPPQSEAIRQTPAQPAVQQPHYIWLGDLGFNNDACTLRNGRGLFACEYDYSSIVDYELIEDGLSHGKRGLGKAIIAQLHKCPHELARKNQARQALQECLASRAAKSQGALPCFKPRVLFCS